jgi:alkylation response protein AidB-like acyl-CoA dehydrogenase
MDAVDDEVRGQALQHEHQLFRETVRAFLRREVQPNHDEWERSGIVPRELFKRAGTAGVIGLAIPPEFGGAGVDDPRFWAVFVDECARYAVIGSTAGIALHETTTTPYFLSYCSPGQRERWLPGIASGDLITAVAMTEPGTGSDLRGIRAQAVRDGDVYILNGSKTFITNGINADLIIVAARTSPPGATDALSLLVVERDMPGFTRGRNLDKIGQHSQDTAELFFDDVRVPIYNLLGEEGRGLSYLMSNLPQERMSMAVSALAVAEAAVEWTVTYVQDRVAFGRPIGAFQNTAFVLAECQTEAAVTRAFVDQCLQKLAADQLSPEEAAMAKLWTTEVQGRVVDRCLQFFGGYGYTTEYPIARAFVDARVGRIYGGSNEIMKELIARSMGLGRA